MPKCRWDTVIVSDPGPDFSRRLLAIAPACRTSARLLVLDRSGWNVQTSEVRALAEVAAIRHVTGRGRHRIWSATMRT